MYAPASEEEIEAIYSKRLAGGEITKEEELKVKDSIYACSWKRVS